MAKYYPQIDDSRNHIQIAFDNWIADYPAPSDFFTPLLTCGSFQVANRAKFCDPGIDAETQRARRLQFTNPRAANRQWAKIERAIMRQAPWVPMINPKLIDYVSRRVGDYQYNPEWGMLIDQLWVR